MRKKVYFLSGYYNNKFLIVYNNREALIADGYMITMPYNSSIEIICLPTEETFVSFITNVFTSYNGNTFAKTENLKCNTEVWENIPFTQEDMPQIKNITMQKIKDRIKFRDCHRLEEIAERTEKVITAIKEIKQRERLHYILKFENLLLELLVRKRICRNGSKFLN